MTDWVTGKVTNIKFWTNSLFSITITAPIKPFIAGQFTKLRLYIHGKYIQRAYSYVNAPNDNNLEFYLIHVPKGVLSSHLAKLKPGDEVQISKESSGFFILKEINDCDILWMFATGTAIGPYLSILQYGGKELDRFQNIVLVHATRYFEDLSYLPKMLKLQEKYEGKLKIQTVVSREIVTGSLIGRIPVLICNKELEKKVGLTINNKTSHVMLCGNPGMVRDTQQVLKETRQMSKHLRRHPGHITIEQYW